MSEPTTQDLLDAERELHIEDVREMAARIAELEAEIRHLRSPAMEEYRRRHEKDFPDGT